MSTKTTFKRIALATVAALGFSVVTSVAPASAVAFTGSVTPVRVSMTGAALDATVYARVSWTTTVAIGASDTVTATLTSAPSAAATVALSNNANVGTSTGGQVWTAGTAGTDSLAQAAETTGIAYGGSGVSLTNGSGAASIGIAANAAGAYRGTVTITHSDNSTDTVSFSFTTRGAVASFTFAQSATETSPSGTMSFTATLLDANGFTTQPGAFDSIGLADANSSPGTFSDDSLGAIGVTTTDLFDGVAVSVFTNTAVVGSSHVVTATPAGTIGTIAAQSLTVIVNSTTVIDTGITALELTAPADAAAVSGTTTATQDVRTGTSAITVEFTGTASSTYRFALTSSAGTVNGASGLVAQFVNATTNSLGKGTISYTLGGAALLAGATSLADVVTVTGGAATGQITVSQADAAISATTNSISPSGAIVRTIGATTSVVVSAKDQFGVALGAGYVIRAYRGTPGTTTLLSTATTDAAGKATVSVVSASTAVNNTAETYNFTYTRPGTAGETTMTGSTRQVVATYTTTGFITSMSTVIADQSGSISKTTILDTDLVATQKLIPALHIAAAGSVDDAAGTDYYTVATGLITSAGTRAPSDMLKITTTNTPGNTTTYTTTTGAFICALATGCDWDGGVASYEASATASVYAYATKTGVHTVTATSGGKSTTITFYAYNLATDYYKVSATADSQSLVTGGNGVITVSVTDIFGNIVDTDSVLTASATGKVRLAGQALTQDFGTTATGSFAFTVLADATAGSGTITIAPTTTGANAWASSYVVPTGAAAPVKSVTLTFTITGATLKTIDDVATAVEAIAAKATADKAESDAKIALLQAALDAAATKAATDKLALDAAIAAAQAAAVAASEAAADAAAEAIDAGNNAFDAATSAGEAADAATAAAEQAGEDAVAAATAAGEAAVAAAEAAQEAAAEATDAANAATDAANASAEAADAATAAAQDAADAVAALSVQVTEVIATLKKQITALTNLVIRIQKKVKA